jgi:hypothetical protein
MKSHQWYSGRKSWKAEQIVKNVKEPKKKTKQTKQILCHEVEPNSSKERAIHVGDNPSFFR